MLVSPGRDQEFSARRLMRQLESKTACTHDERVRSLHTHSDSYETKREGALTENNTTCPLLALPRGAIAVIDCLGYRFKLCSYCSCYVVLVPVLREYSELFLVSTLSCPEVSHDEVERDKYDSGFNFSSMIDYCRANGNAPLLLNFDTFADII